mmetsp:Transcript_11675/g.14281  ORF Transcript_11675/g.14281 Transcript_11675/m.14281 type:complete len:108 (+) Transcript_11675:126-449(+)
MRRVFYYHFVLPLPSSAIFKVELITPTITPPPMVSSSSLLLIDASALIINASCVSCTHTHTHNMRFFSSLPSCSIVYDVFHLSFVNPMKILRWHLFQCSLPLQSKED